MTSIFMELGHFSRAGQIIPWHLQTLSSDRNRPSSPILAFISENSYLYLPTSNRFSLSKSKSEPKPGSFFVHSILPYRNAVLIKFCHCSRRGKFKVTFLVFFQFWNNGYSFIKKGKKKIRYQKKMCPLEKIVFFILSMNLK